MSDIREYLEGKKELDDVMENNVSKLDKLSQYMDYEKLLTEIVKQGLSVDNLKSHLEYILRMHDTGGRMTELRDEVDNARGRKELTHIVDELEQVMGAEGLVEEFARAMSTQTFDQIAGETARLYDLPTEIRDLF